MPNTIKTAQNAFCGISVTCSKHYENAVYQIPGQITCKQIFEKILDVVVFLSDLMYFQDLEYE